MNIIQKTQTYDYYDKFTNEYIPKGGYLVSDLMSRDDLEMHGGGIGINAFRDFFADLSIPTGLYVSNIPAPMGAKPRVSERKETIIDADFNKLLESVFVSKPRGEQTHKKKQEKPKSIKTLKTHYKHT
jgi:hypothetical protein